MTASRKYTFDAGQSPKPVLGTTARRIRAVRDIPEHGVRAGDLGGYIEHEHNLAHEGAAWVADQALAIGQSRVEGNALACDWTSLTSYAVATGSAVLSGYSRVRDHAMIVGDTRLAGLSSALDQSVIDTGPDSADFVTAIGTALIAGAVPPSLSLMSPSDRDYLPSLFEAAAIDPAFERLLILCGAKSQAQRRALILELMDGAEKRRAALWALTRTLGGTFYPETYEARDSRAVTAEQALAVHRLLKRWTVRNARVICMIGKKQVSDTKPGHEFYAAVAMVMLSDRTLFQPLVLHGYESHHGLNPMPLHIESVPEGYGSLPDAEARSHNIIAQLSYQEPVLDPSSIRRSQVECDIASVPLLLDSEQEGSTANILIQIGSGSSSTFATVTIGPEFDCHFDFAHDYPATVREYPRRPLAALSPTNIRFDLPAPSAALAELLDRAAHTTPEEGKTIMKRDMDLIRSILMEIEEDVNINGRFIVSDADLRQEGADASKIQYHLRLLMDAGYIEGHDANKLTGGITPQKNEPGIPRREDLPTIQVTRMTWEGHDFLETVRDPKVWQKTKGYLKDVGGVGIDVLKDVAKTVLKDQIKQYTGISLG